MLLSTPSSGVRNIQPGAQIWPVDPVDLSFRAPGLCLCLHPCLHWSSAVRSCAIPGYVFCHQCFLTQLPNFPSLWHGHSSKPVESCTGVRQQEALPPHTFQLWHRSSSNLDAASSCPAPAQLLSGQKLWPNVR